MRSRLRRSAWAAALTVSVAVTKLDAATITIIDLDPANQGLNDPTPASPVGGNTATTVGAQRMAVFQQAAFAAGSRG